MNYFNFEEPMYGDIYGFTDSNSCCGDCSCDGEEGGDEIDLTCLPSALAEPLRTLNFQPEDDQLCR